MGQRDNAMVKQPVSVGGKANEAGSVHRSGVAAYLAAHGLAGRGVEAAGYSENGPSPVTLAFETGEAVDDIRCGLTDHTALLLQAKRACGADEHLAATVAQWARQVGQLGHGDRIGLAVAEPKGQVRALGAALDRRRRPVRGQFTPGEQNALNALRARLPAATPEETAERMLDRAIVMAVAASSLRDEGFRSAAHLLDGTVVRVGSGSKALAALQHAFQQQAAAGTGSGLDEWLKILRDAGVEVIPDADGPAGQRRRAELDALAAHRARLAARDGILEFSLLGAEDLPPMTYKPLADSLRVSIPGRKDSESFLTTARRWPRMLLTGLPGMGKTTALEQAAARWAVDVRAPTPVLVPLHDLARRQPRRSSDVTLAVLIDVATVNVPAQERLSLRRALERTVSAGDAILLLDGLDECQGWRATVADGLAAVIADLPSGAGVVLATRSSGLAAARKLKLPEAELVEPSGLDRALRALLRHAAASMAIPEAERDRWMREREQRLGEIRSNHWDLWRVPLLATLLTLLAIRRDTGLLPAGRARLLAEAVQDTVRRWELARLWETRPYPRLRADQLLDGYSEIAHAVIRASSDFTRAAVRNQVAAMLKAQWELAPAEAAAQAADIMWFWDERVGVFVASPATANIQARSRVFAETGDAMWAVRQDRDTRREWMAAAIGDRDRREPVVLAASMSSDIASELIEIAGETADPASRSRALWWAADATADGAELGDTSRELLVTGLAHAAREAADRTLASAADGGVADDRHRSIARPGWQYVLRIAMLPLGSDVRRSRDSVLAGLVLDDTERAIVEALTALADARADSREALDPSQVAAVNRVLSMPIPERTPLQPTGRGTVVAIPAHRLLAGRYETAEQATAYARQLDIGAISAIYRIAHLGSVGGYWRICDRMSALGYADPEPLRMGADMTDFAERMAHVWDEWKTFLAVVASLAPPRALTLGEHWRYPHLAALDDVLGVESATLDGIDCAMTIDQALLPGWIRAAAHAAGLDMAAMSAQASAALAAWSAGDQDVIDVMFAPPHSPLPACDASRLDDDDLDALFAALGAASDWLSDTACTVLMTAANPAVGQDAAALIPHIPPNRRQNAAIAAIANNPCPPLAAGHLLDSADPLARVGAAFAAQTLAGDAADGWTSILARARADDDLTVRLAAGADESTTATAAHWSCLGCGHMNEFTASNCASCGDGRRPVSSTGACLAGE